jgi:hypothetical protein
VDDWTGRGVGLQTNGCNAADWTGPEGGCTTPLVPAGSPFESLLNTVFTRVNIASGPYQMVSILSDAMVFRCGTAGDAGDPRAMTAEYFEEIPVEYFHARFDTSPRVVWHFGYEKQRQSLHDSRRLGTLFQVHFWYYPGTGGGCTALDSVPIEQTFTIPAARVGPQLRVREKEILRLGEELHGSWNAYELRQRVGEWIHMKVVALLDAAATTSGATATMEAAPQPIAGTSDVDELTLQTCVATLPKLADASGEACKGKSHTGGGAKINDDAPMGTAIDNGVDDLDNVRRTFFDKVFALMLLASNNNKCNGSTC